MVEIDPWIALYMYYFPEDYHGTPPIPGYGLWVRAVASAVIGYNSRREMRYF
jgi:hypothetical protein